jgi:hypothetical protein
MKSFDYCPCCRQRIELRKNSSGFVCPACGCVFRHDFRKWLIAIPVAIVVALALFRFVGSFIPPILIGFLVAPAVAIIILSRFPTYIVARPPAATREV